MPCLFVTRVVGAGVDHDDAARHMSKQMSTTVDSAGRIGKVCGIEMSQSPGPTHPEVGGRPQRLQKRFVNGTEAEWELKG